MISGDHSVTLKTTEHYIDLSACSFLALTSVYGKKNKTANLLVKQTGNVEINKKQFFFQG